MSEESTNQQSISDDQELAKVLAGVSQHTDDATDTTSGLPTVDPVAAPSYDQTNIAVDTPVPAQPAADSYSGGEQSLTPPSEEVAERASAPTTHVSSELDSVKQEALNELRPLVDKLEVSPEEKFDTYLLLLRSTDDKDLIAPAHEAAKNIGDEARRAQALLDIIKEIDFLSQKQ